MTYNPLLFCEAGFNCLLNIILPLAFLPQDKFNSFKVVLLTKTFPITCIPTLPILHNVSVLSFELACRLFAIFITYSSIPLSPQSAKLLTRQFVMIVQYTLHGDVLFLLRSTYSSADMFSLSLITYLNILFIPMSLRLQPQSDRVFHWFFDEADMKKIKRVI